MKDSRTFVTMFIDNGTFSGRATNNLSQIGGWSVYIFTDSVVFLTMPLGDRISVFAGPALGLFSHHPGHAGPNKKLQDKTRKVQRELLDQAESIIERAGIDRVASDDLGAIPGAVVVPASNIKRVTLKPHRLIPKATCLLFEMHDKDPQVPFRERKRQRAFTFAQSSHLADIEELAFALERTFGEKFENSLKTGEQPAAPVTGHAGVPHQQLKLSHGNFVNAVAFNLDGTRLATSSADKQARIWDAITGRQLIQMTHDGRVLRLAFGPDGTRLATAGTEDKTARIWDTTTGRELTRLRHQAPVLEVAFSPDGTRLATASDTQGRIWDIATGRELTRVKHQGPVIGVVFSPDGTRLATAGTDDKTARIWDTATGRELIRVKHQGSVHGVAFSPDGTRLATGGRDKTARIWDCATGAELVRIPHDHFVHEVAFNNDGSRLATANGDKTARIWRLYPPS
jgi:sugar lactone lactonase YvrE